MTLRSCDEAVKAELFRIVSEVAGAGERPSGPYEAVGIWSDVRGFLGAVIYYAWANQDVQIAIAAMPGWCTRGNLRSIFGYPFGQLGVRRVTAEVRADNLRSRTLCEQLGFRLEGTVRRGCEDGCDRLIYGMLRQECRWWHEEERAGGPGPVQDSECAAGHECARSVGAVRQGDVAA